MGWQAEGLPPIRMSFFLHMSQSTGSHLSKGRGMVYKVAAIYRTLSQKRKPGALALPSLLPRHAFH